MRRHTRPNGQYVSLRQVEAEYALPYHLVYRWIQRGLLPALDRDVAGRSIVIKRADLEQFLESHMTTAVQP